MSVHARVGSSTPGATRPFGRRTAVLVAALVAWTLFVWVGRIRNVLADDDLGPGDRVGTLLLAASFVLAALALVALGLARRARPGAAGPARGLTAGLVCVAVWTAVVWALRVGDIALGGDHDAGFVVVHVVLAVVSIGLAVAATVSDALDARATTNTR